MQLVLNHAPSTEEVPRGGHRHHLYVNLLRWVGGDLSTEGVSEDSCRRATALVCDGWSGELACKG